MSGEETVDQFLTEIMKQNEVAFVLVISKGDGLRSLFTNCDQEGKMDLLNAAVLRSERASNAKPC